MASTVTFTAAQGKYNTDCGRVAVYTFDCTTHTDGTCTGHAQTIAQGYLHQVLVVPDTGDTKPSDNFALVMADGNGLDVLGGAGATVDADAPTLYRITPAIYLPSGTTLDAQIASGGDSNGVTVTVVVR